MTWSLSFDKAAGLLASSSLAVSMKITKKSPCILTIELNRLVIVSGGAKSITENYSPQLVMGCSPERCRVKTILTKSVTNWDGYDLVLVT